MDLYIKQGETEEQYLWRVGQMVDSKQLDSWESILDVVNRSILGDDEEKYRTESAWRKKYQAAKKFFDGCFCNMISENDQLEEFEKIKSDIRKERMKLQTANLERNRLDRIEARQEMYYEFVGSMVEALPVPEIIRAEKLDDNNITYMVTLSDFHYGAKFISHNNEYSPEICKDRLFYVADYLKNFVEKNHVSRLIISELGDSLQGILRLSDLQINDTSVMKATVDFSRMMAEFLNSVSEFVDVDYYHVPTANHTQIRPLGSKASELGAEDLEYVICHYIKDLCINNKHININIAEENKQYVDLDLYGFNILMMHGHQFKNADDAIKNLTMLTNDNVDYVIMGHFHGGKETPSNEGSLHDCEVLVSPSFVGSDPYSDSLMKGSKAAVKIYGFDEFNGHTETYKIILN